MIDVHAEGVGAVSAMLAEVAKRALNPEPAFEKVTDHLIDAEQRLFASRARLKPLEDATKARKARAKDPRTRANADRPLIATGSLERYLTTKGPAAQPVRMTSDELVFGVPGGRHDFHYARYQAKLGRNPLVSRDVLHRWAGRELTSFIARNRSA